MAESVKSLDITVDPNKLDDGVREILKRIRPEWKPDSIKIKNVTNGFINKLVICNSGDSMKDAVVIKVYPGEDCLLFDSEMSRLGAKTANDAKLSAELICIFENGLVHSFLGGKPYGWENAADFITNEKLSGALMREMARWHSGKTVELAKKNGLKFPKRPYKLDIMKEMLDTLPSNVEDPRRKQILSKKELEDEAGKMNEMVEKMNCRIVFAHGDTNPANVIYDDVNDKLTLIDYDESCFDTAEHDLAQFFTTVAFYVSKDNEEYEEPSTEWQLSLTKLYLEKRKELGDIEEEITEELIQKYFIATSKMALCFLLEFTILMIHFAATPVAEDTPIEVDYLDVGIKTQSKYLELRDMLLEL